LSSSDGRRLRLLPRDDESTGAIYLHGELLDIKKTPPTIIKIADDLGAATLHTSFPSVNAFTDRTTGILFGHLNNYRKPFNKTNKTPIVEVSDGIT